MDNAQVTDPPPAAGIHVQELFAIGLTDSDLLGQPVDLATDSQGRIYVLDQIGPAVRVYSQQGDSLYTIGRRGEGPGELDRPTALHITADDRILVTDHGARRITEFNSDGTYEQVWPMTRLRGSWVLPENMQQVDDSTFIVEGSIRNSSGDRRPSERLHVMVLGEDSIHVLEDFFRPESHLGDLSPQYQHLIGLTGGSLLLDGEGRVLYSPYPYNGDVFVFGRGEDGRWSLQEKWRGFVEYAAPYSERDPDEMEDDESSLFTFTRVGPEGRETVGGIFHNASRGLYRFQDHRIVHFTEIRYEGVRTLGVEMYDYDGTLIGFRPIPDLAVEGFGWTPVVAWKDTLDRFYIITATPEEEGGIPVVRVIALTAES